MSPGSVPRDQFALAAEVGAAITSALVFGDALTEVARRIAETLGTWECSLYEYYRGSDTLVASACWTRAPSAEDLAWTGTVVDLRDCPTYQTLVAERSLRESYIDEADAADRTMMARWGQVSALSAPLVFEGQVVGCLTVAEKHESRRFDEQDKELISLMAIPAAVAVHNARLFRLQEQENRHLASLLDSSRALTSTVVLEDVLGLVSRTAGEALGCTQCAIYEYDEPRGAAVLRTLWKRGADERDEESGSACRLADLPAEREVAAGHDPVVRSFSDRALTESDRAWMEQWGERTRVEVPLVAADEPVGLLVFVESERERRFSDEELELARGLGEHAAVAIRNAQLFRRQERLNKRLLALFQTSRVLAGSLNAGEVLAEVSREVAELFAVSASAVELYLHTSAGYLTFEDVPEAAWGDDAADAAGARQPAELDGLRRLAIEERRPAQEPGGAHARLVVPLGFEEEGSGFVEVSAAAGHRFSDDEVGLLQVLAGQAAAAIVHARLYRAIELQAITDGLTGLYNHRYFYERLEQEWARARRYDLPLSVLMIDIDDFKYFNDQYGHLVGDGVLVEVGRVLRTQLRRGVDLAARYGGEEFAVLLPNTARDSAEVVGQRLVHRLAELAADAAAPVPPSARAVGERIRQSIAVAVLPGTSSGEDAHVTVSIGIAALDGAPGVEPDHLMRAADEALYRAKRLGKNRVEVSGD